MRSKVDFYALAGAALQYGEYDKAFELFSRAAKNGDSDAMGRIALMYADGEGVARDIDKSIHWDLKAIESGNKASMFNLALTYRNQGDYIECRKWFEHALQSGDFDEAALELAKLLMINNKDPDQVRSLLRLVVESPNVLIDYTDKAREIMDSM